MPPLRDAGGSAIVERVKHSESSFFATNMLPKTLLQLVAIKSVELMIYLLDFDSYDGIESGNISIEENVSHILLPIGISPYIHIFLLPLQLTLVHHLICLTMKPFCINSSFFGIDAVF